MTTNHKASASEWQSIEKCASVVGSADCSALLELRSRIEALERGATCPHIATSDEGTAYCRVADQTASSQPTPNDRQIRSSDDASSLVERVADAIVTKATSAGIVNDRPARAAIREVAAWLEGRNVGAGRATARWLLEEVER